MHEQPVCACLALFPVSPSPSEREHMPANSRHLEFSLFTHAATILLSGFTQHIPAGDALPPHTALRLSRSNASRVQIGCGLLAGLQSSLCDDPEEWFYGGLPVKQAPKKDEPSARCREDDAR